MLDGFASESLAFLRLTASQWHFLGPLVSAIFPTAFETDPASACLDLQHSFNLTGTTILNATYFPNATQVHTLGTCQSHAAMAHIGSSLCRVQFMVNTSDTSAITAEAWLPSKWNGRFLALGNGGLGGCIDYENLNYGTSLQFATVASDNGHDGDTGIYFANNSEVLSDFTSRAIHVESVVGKQLSAVYYGYPHRKSYYLGCSTGGRQGTYAALHYPEDFDGIVAGAPATNFHSLLGRMAMLTRYIGAPHPESSPSFISPGLWKVVVAEVLNQCDELDGAKDGVVTEPDSCNFRPEAIQCTGKLSSNCLTKPQVEALRKIYAPLYGSDGELIFPRFDPGAEGASQAQTIVFSGRPFRYAEHWLKYAIYNDTNYDYSSFSTKDIAVSNAIDPGLVSTFSGDMSAFNARGGKFLTYHGRSDELIPSGNAKTLYNLVSRTLSMPSLDSFYRLFLIPGMGHCSGGVGAVNIGQHGRAVPSANIPSHNVLLAIVDWVENGNAPDTITGTSADGRKERIHCRYPQRSFWDGKAYVCLVT